MEPAMIVVAGGINIDTTFMVAHLPRTGETVFSTEQFEALGGKGLNQAIAAKRAGVPVAILGTVGCDAEGSRVSEFLEGEGINTELLYQCKELPTGRAIITVDHQANNMIVVSPGANQITVSTAFKLLLANWRNIDSVLANGEFGFPETRRLFSDARQSRTTTVWNPSPVPQNPNDILGLVDILVLNETEASSLVPESRTEVELLETLLRLGPSEVVLTLGGDGCLVATENEIVRIPARHVSAVDPTAAGDTFLGYYLAARARNDAPPIAAAAASVAASIAVETRGAVTSVPKRSEVEPDLVRQLLDGATAARRGSE